MTPAVYDPVSYERRDRCTTSYCCSTCFLACECCADKDEDSHVRRLLSVDEYNPLVIYADRFAAGAVEEEMRLFENHDEDEDDEEEEDDDEAEEEAPLVLTNVVLLPEV